MYEDAHQFGSECVKLKNAHLGSLELFFPDYFFVCYDCPNGLLEKM